MLQTAEGTKRVPKLDKKTGCWVTFVQEQEQEQELQAELREHGRIANKKKKPQGTADTKGLFSWQISPAPPYTPVARRCAPRLRQARTPLMRHTSTPRHLRARARTPHSSLAHA